MSLIEIIDHRIEQKSVKWIDTAVVASVNPTSLTVRFSGAPQLQEIDSDERLDLRRGDDIVVIRPPSSPRWMALCAFSRNGNRTLGTGKPQTFVLAPPSGLHAVAAIPGSALIAWNVPPQLPVSFEVQTNTTATDEGATKVLSTRGCYFILVGTTNFYVRVRSVYVDRGFKYSSWTDWLAVTPLPALDLISNFVDLLDVDIVDPDAYVVPYFNPIASKWQAMPNPLFALPYEFVTVGGQFVFMDGEFTVSPKTAVYAGGLPALCGGQLIA